MPILIKPGKKKDKSDFSNKQNTRLNRKQKKSFEETAKSFSGLKNDKRDYDSQGFFKEVYKKNKGDSKKISEALTPGSPTQHIGTDKFKKTNHPTFSNESKRSNILRKGGEWKEDEFVANKRNVKNMKASDGSPENYMNRAEDYDGDGKSDVKLSYKNKKATNQTNNIMPDSRIKIKKSAGIKRQEKKGIVTPGSKKNYKIVVKSNDPQRNTGGYTSMEKTEITQKKADKLNNRKVRTDVENAGKLTQNINDITNKPVKRYAGTKVVSGKSNLNLKGRVLKMFVGKEGVAIAESKKKNNQYERATTGTQKFVTKANSDSPVEMPKPKFDPNSNRTKNKQTVGEIKNEEQSSQAPKTSVGSGPTINKKRTPTVTQTYGKGGVKVTYPK